MKWLTAFLNKRMHRTFSISNSCRPFSMVFSLYFFIQSYPHALNSYLIISYSAFIIRLLRDWMKGRYHSIQYIHIYWWFDIYDENLELHKITARRLWLCLGKHIDTPGVRKVILSHLYFIFALSRHSGSRLVFISCQFQPEILTISKKI